MITKKEYRTSPGRDHIYGVRMLLMRQPRTTLSKIAFRTFLLVALGGIGGTVAITLGSGAPSRDIVTMMVCGIIATILVASRVRVLQIVATFLGAYLVYLIVTEPFVIESLTSPKGPHGGFGAFIGEVLLAANTMIGFVATFGTVVQGFRGEGPRVPGWFPAVLVGVAGLVVGASLIGAFAQPVSIPALVYTNGVPTLHVSAGGFDLPSVTIAKGSKLLLVDDTSSEHVLANGSWQNNAPLQKREPGAPLVETTLKGNSATVGPFAVAGTYHILCLIHHGMNLTINVQ